MSTPFLALPSAAATPLSAVIPAGVDVAEVIADVQDDSISAPAADVDGLAAAVSRAESDGIALSIVVVDRDPGQDSQLRDLATQVGASEGGTVLVLSPGQVGSFSDSISRVVLEAGQDRTYVGDPVVAADNFVDEISGPGTPWTAYTVVLIVLVAVVVAATYAVNVRRFTDGRSST
ncbi:DUF6676 family protein [Actinomycetes bacterium M1A6_2h]